MKIHIIPIALIIDYELYSCAYGATEEEYQEWLVKRDFMPKNCIPADYLEDYLNKRGYEAELKKTQIGENYYPVFLPPTHVRTILLEKDLSYEDFIDEYAKYLKSIV